MTNKGDPQKTDMLGIAAYGEALNTLAKGAVDGSGAFLSRICLPAAEEFGLLLKDKISVWRANNAVDIALKAEKLLAASQRDNVHAHPKLVMKVLSEGSWADDDNVRSFWAGLLASSCTEDGQDESNIIFLNLLTQITTLQARIIEYSCANATISLGEHGLIQGELDDTSLEDVFKIAGCEDIHRVDRELDHLRSLELIGGDYIGGGGIDMNTGSVNIAPTALALHFYARCKGSVESVEEFYSSQTRN